MPDDDMGKSDVAQGGSSITNHTFDVAAKDWGMTREQAKKNTYKLLKREFGGK